MTGGFNQDGSAGANASAGTASRLLQPRDDRETLSALLDGELPADAARFALKRLSHDVHWRETCGRWQLIGDALRGEPVGLASTDFAAGVARALGTSPGTAEQAVEPAAGRPRAAFPQGRWMGGAALAASLAIAAVLVVRPTPSSPTAAPVPEVAQSAPAQAAPAPTSRVLQADAPPLQSAPLVAAGGDSAMPAVPAPRPARARPTRQAPVLPAAEVPATTSESAIAAVAVPPVPSPAPFQLPSHDEVTTRPWPRAVLPGSSAAGGFTVGLEAASSPAFYPFEPQPSVESAPEGEDPSLP